jgi:hypothetical protein
MSGKRTIGVTTLKQEKWLSNGGGIITVLILDMLEKI